MVYQFKPGSRLKGDAATVATHLEKIANKNAGDLRPEAVVEAARTKRSPLHEFFEWDDSAAAHEYRLTQARHLIRSIEVITVDDGDRVNAFHNVVVKNDDNDEVRSRAYVTLQRAMTDDDLRQQVVDSLYAQAQSFVRQAKAFNRHAADFEPVVRAIESLPPLDQLRASA